MKIKILLMAVVLTGLLFGLSASAQIVCANPQTTDQQCIAEVPISVTGLTYDREIPKFDESLGELQSVRIISEACGYTRLDLDSRHPTPQSWFITTQGGIILTLPTGQDIIATFGTPQGTEDQIDTSADTDPDHIPPEDFIGTDWGFVEYGTANDPVCESNDTVIDTEAGMAIFKGSAGETLPVDITTFSNSLVRNPLSNNYESRSISEAGGSVCVEYTYCPLLCINGTKINECTGEGIPGWEICLTGSDGTQTCTTTDANGDYSFCELASGAYHVCEETRAGWVPMDPTCRDVTLDEGSAEGVDFTNAPLVCISGHKFDSKTNAGLSGWTIQLKDENGALIDTTTTGTGGLYQFCDLEPGSYTVSEVQKAGWKAIGPTSIDVELVACEDIENVDFFNEPTNLVCVCPFFIKNDLYTASCHAVYEVDAAHGILANDPAGSIVLNPELITIDPKYGTITVEEDGSFVYDPTGATGITRSGAYVIFKYAANNGLCDSKYLGIAKIQVSCK